MPEPFRVAVPQPVLDELARRLEAARWPEAYALDGGEDPVRLERIRQLLERWRGGYDWREQEARINEYEQHLAAGLHVMNGWPSSVAEYLSALPLLADFEVWIVGRLGYGFSDLGLDQPGDDEHAATLAGHVLGDGRYAAHGDDFGNTDSYGCGQRRRTAGICVARRPGCVRLFAVWEIN